MTLSYLIISEIFVYQCDSNDNIHIQYFYYVKNYNKERKGKDEEKKAGNKKIENNNSKNNKVIFLWRIKY